MKISRQTLKQAAPISSFLGCRCLLTKDSEGKMDLKQFEEAVDGNAGASDDARWQRRCFSWPHALAHPLLGCV
jgi:hypothetical protein